VKEQKDSGFSSKPQNPKESQQDEDKKKMVIMHEQESEKA